MGIVAAFRELDATVDAIEDLKQQKITDITVYTPTPRHEIDQAVSPPMSPVRRFTLIGGMCGAIFGYWIAIWTSDYWPLVVGGKAIATWIPFTIIGFRALRGSHDPSGIIVGTWIASAASVVAAVTVARWLARRSPTPVEAPTQAKE